MYYADPFPTHWVCPKCGKNSIRIFIRRRVVGTCGSCGFAFRTENRGSIYEEVDYYSIMIDSFYDKLAVVLKEEIKKPSVKRKLVRRPVKIKVEPPILHGPIAKGAVVKVEIYDVIYGDYYGVTGMGKIKDMPIFVIGAMVGDVVRVKIKSVVENTFALGEIIA